MRLVVRLGMVGIVVVGVGLAGWWWLRRPEPLTIGLVGSFSGRFASLGTTGRDGALLAVDEINAAGGIAGRPLALRILDDHGEGPACIAAYETLAAEGRRLVIGPFATGAATAAVETMDRHRILSIGPTVAGDNLGGRDDWFLRLYPSTRAMGQALARMHLEDGGGRLAVIGDQANGPFLATTCEGLREVLAGQVELAEVTFDSRQRPDLAAVASRVDGCTAAVLVASSLDAAVLAQRLRAQRPGLRLQCASWAVSKELIANGGAAVDGMRTVLPVALGDGSSSSLEERYRRRYGEEMSHVARLHHDAVLLLAAALRAVGDDPALVRARLIEPRDLPGAPPGCQLDRHGDPRRDLLPHRIIDGVLRCERAAGDP